MTEQSVECIRASLDWTVCHLQQYLCERRGDCSVKRHQRCDASLIAVLVMVADLLPLEIQEQIKRMITMHDEVCRLEIEEYTALASSFKTSTF
jgi:hypothetical protein